MDEGGLGRKKDKESLDPLSWRPSPRLSPSRHRTSMVPHGLASHSIGSVGNSRLQRRGRGPPGRQEGTPSTPIGESIRTGRGGAGESMARLTSAMGMAGEKRGHKPTYYLSVNGSYLAVNDRRRRRFGDGAHLYRHLPIISLASRTLSSFVSFVIALALEWASLFFRPRCGQNRRQTLKSSDKNPPIL